MCGGRGFGKCMDEGKGGGWMDVWGDGGLGSVWRKVGGLSVCGGWGVGKCMDEGKGEGWMDVWGERIWEVYGGRVAGWMCGGWGMYGEGGGAG